MNPIKENDVEQIINLYKLCYGESYPYKDFYEPYWIKKGVYSDSIIWLAVKDDNSVLGSGALMLEAGDHTDLMGEFGRFVVNPNIVPEIITIINRVKVIVVKIRVVISDFDSNHDNISKIGIEKIP